MTGAPTAWRLGEGQTSSHRNNPAGYGILHTVPDLVQNKEERRTLVKTVMKLRVP